MRGWTVYVIGVLLGAAQSWAATEPVGQYEICRIQGGGSSRECYSFESDCKGGIKAAGVRARKCAAVACMDLKAMFAGTVEDLKALPAAERLEKAGTLVCNHFRMDLPDTSYSACIGVQRAAANALFDLFIQVGGYCK